MAPAFVYHILSYALSILPKYLRAKLWCYLLNIGERRWGISVGAARIPGGMYIKLGLRVRFSEGEALRFVRSKTRLPVPVVVDNFTYGKSTYLVMSRMPGYPLDAFYNSIPPDAEPVLSKQLSELLAQLRAIPPPSNSVCGFDGGPVHCERISMGSNPCGPWESVAAFHEKLMERTLGLNIRPGYGDPEVVHDVIKRAHARTHRICLTHGDLGPHNILVDENWKITGIIDWETCAWMPEYW